MQKCNNQELKGQNKKTWNKIGHLRPAFDDIEIYGKDDKDIKIYFLAKYYAALFS